MTTTTSVVARAEGPRPCGLSCPPSQTERVKNDHRPVSVALRWGLPVLALAFLARSVQAGWGDISDSLVAFTGNGTALVIGALLIEVAWTLTLSQVYRSSIIAFGGEATWRQSLRVSMGAFTLSRILPGGGAVGALLAGREFVKVGNPAPLTLVALIVAGWVSLTTLALLVSLVIAVGCLTGFLQSSMLVVPAATLTALGLVGVCAVGSMQRPEWRMRIVQAIERIFSKWSTGMKGADLESVLSRPVRNFRWRLATVSGWATASWILDAAALWMVFAAFDHHLHLSALAVGYGAANLIQALPEVTPGWLGVLEGALAVVYAGFGVPLGPAVLAVLGYRVVSFWIPVVAGLPWALSIIRGSGRSGRQ